MSDLGSGDEGISGQKYQQGLEAGGTDFDSGQQGMHGEQELATKMLQIQSKRFYLDVKQNKRGRFIKVAEIGADGRRSQIFLALSTAAEFRDHLSAFSDFYASLGPPNPENVPDDGKLRSEMMIKDNRRYYLDLKENSRGRFLRVSQTITRGGPRSQIAIPAQGMIEFRDALTDLLDEFGTDDGGFRGELPEGRHIRVENKNFYFDIGQNNRGIYMRISEVKNNFRTAITLPEKSWTRFRDILADYCDKIKQAELQGGSSQATASSGGSSSQQGGGSGSASSAAGQQSKKSLPSPTCPRSMKPSVKFSTTATNKSRPTPYNAFRRLFNKRYQQDKTTTDPRKTRSAELNKKQLDRRQYDNTKNDVATKSNKKYSNNMNQLDEESSVENLMEIKKRETITDRSSNSSQSTLSEEVDRSKPSKEIDRGDEGSDKSYKVLQQDKNFPPAFSSTDEKIS